jgi:hypothetical protein
MQGFRGILKCCQAFAHFFLKKDARILRLRSGQAPAGMTETSGENYIA